MNSKIVWAETLEVLRDQMSGSAFNTWMAESELVSAENGRFVVSVRNEYARSWLADTHGWAIEQALTVIAGKETSVSFVVAGDRVGEAVVVGSGGAAGFGEWGWTDFWRF